MDILNYIDQNNINVQKLINEAKVNKCGITEEATKNALIMPFINLLGYNVFDPNEVKPEFICDIGDKKGEKVDYLIKANQKDSIIIECKSLSVDLNGHATQLSRYFVTCDAKIAILTNGLKYQFYSDLDNKNIMDKTPFYIFDVNAYTEDDLNQLTKFSKSQFDLDTIIETAYKLKYINGIQKHISELINNPSPEFIKLICKPVYDGLFTERAVNKLSCYVKEAFDKVVKYKMFDKINQKSIEETNEKTNDVVKIVTTPEETKALEIIKQICSELVNPDDIVHKDYIHVFSIGYKKIRGATWCKLLFTDTLKIQFGNDELNKVTLQSVNDLCNYKSQILSALKTVM